MVVDNSWVIVLLCSYLCNNVEYKPFETREWSDFAIRLMECGIKPVDLLSFSARDFGGLLGLESGMIERVQKLLERGSCLKNEIGKYEEMGIHIMTRADSIYPVALKSKLGQGCPPLFYYSGDPILFTNKYVGFVGSRSIDISAERFTVGLVDKINKRGYGVVSGGAKGVDSISVVRSLQNDNSCIEYLSDSLKRNVSNPVIGEYIRNNKLLLLSISHPEAGFDTGMAMSRNRFIYSQSLATVIVKSDLKKGGTWSGATDNLKKGYCVSFCWGNGGYPGNMELINRGAIPIDEDWDGEMGGYLGREGLEFQQMSLF